MNSTQICPECGSNKLHTAFSNSAGPYGPTFLPGLGSFLTPAQFRIVLCSQCGFTRFFADRSALAKLAKSRAWIPNQQRAFAEQEKP